MCLNPTPSQPRPRSASLYGHHLILQPWAGLGMLALPLPGPCMNPMRSRDMNPMWSRDMVLKDFTNVSTPLRAMLRAILRAILRAQHAVWRAKLVHCHH